MDTTGQSLAGVANVVRQTSRLLIKMRNRREAAVSNLPVLVDGLCVCVLRRVALRKNGNTRKRQLNSDGGGQHVARQ